MATPTDDDKADDCISGDSYRCERGFTLAKQLFALRRSKTALEVAF